MSSNKSNSGYSIIIKPNPLLHEFLQKNSLTSISSSTLAVFPIAIFPEGYMFTMKFTVPVLLQLRTGENTGIRTGKSTLVLLQGISFCCSCSLSVSAAKVWVDVPVRILEAACFCVSPTFSY